MLQSLPAEWQDRLADGLLPLRHVEWGANMNNLLLRRLRLGHGITQVTAPTARWTVSASPST
ncbi:hypothetical protein ACU4GD_03385 [Cupriavidus basilensis]